RRPFAGAHRGGRRPRSGIRRSAWGAIISLISERNVVFHVVELARRLLGRRGCGPGLAAAARGRLARLARALATPEHLHHVGADLGGVAVLAVLVLPLARAQLALDIDLRALLQVLAGDLRQATVEGDAMPLGRLLLLAARLVFPGVRGGD